AEIEETLTEYLSDERFINAQLRQKEAVYNQRKTRVVLIYELLDPYSYEIALRGNDKISTGEILRNLKLDEYTAGSANTTRDLADRVRTYYISQGFAHVKVTHMEEVKTNQYRKISRLAVNEGPRVRIKQLEI